MSQFKMTKKVDEIKVSKKTDDMSKFDRLLHELAEKGMTYAEWQKQAYPVKVERKERWRNIC